MAQMRVRYSDTPFGVFLGGILRRVFRTCIGRGAWKQRQFLITPPSSCITLRRKAPIRQIIQEQADELVVENLGFHIDLMPVTLGTYAGTPVHNDGGPMSRLMLCRLEETILPMAFPWVILPT